MEALKLGLICAIAFTFAMASHAICAQTLEPSKVFAAVLEDVQRTTDLKILLPTAFPSQIKESDIHYAEGSGSKGKYEITLFYEKEYGDSGLFGTFSAVSNRKPNSNLKKVGLTNGQIGYYRPKSCGGSCSPTYIAWTQGDVLYTAMLKLPAEPEIEDEKVMVEIVNSALSTAHR